MNRVMRRFHVLAILAGLSAPVSISTAAAPDAKDLNPVTAKPAPAHEPVTLVADGVVKAKIVVFAPHSQPLAQAVVNLQEFIEKSTGAKLEVVQKPEQVSAPAIVIGDCELAKQNGIDASKIPYDGFVVKTAKDYVFIVGRDETLIDLAVSTGSAWGVYDFLERFVGARWYFPTELGQIIPQTKTLAVPAVWLEDAPAYRMRVMWPPMANPNNGTGTPLMPIQTFLRSGNSWPIQLRVHQPDWGRLEDYRTNRPEVFQLRSDGTRDTFMLCYGNPKTLATYLENIEAHLAGKPAHIGIAGDAITVSPNDAEVACYCKDCRKLWNEEGGQWGSASKVVGQFVANLAVEVKKRWPGKTVIYLPYLNYTAAPDGVTFPDNVEVQICGMPGIAQYKEASILAFDQANIDKWQKLTGRKIQNWHYSCWPANRTSAPYQYPHVVQKFYQSNRDKTIGTFINGERDHWPRHHLSMYCWLKVLWDPDTDIDATIDEYCARVFGPAAGTMRELVKIEIEGWEKSEWPGGRFSPKGIYQASFPPAKVAEMQKLLEKARQEVASDAQAKARFEYFAEPLGLFFKDSQDYHSGAGFKPLVIQKVGENPTIDGKLDEESWKRAEPVPFVRGWDKAKREPTYGTTAQGVWTADGVTFGFRMVEPTPDRLERKIKGTDDSMAWWDDNVEILVDPSGKSEGEYYQFIYNPNAAVADAKGSDFSWNAKGTKIQSFVGPDFWSVEAYFPYEALPGAVKPGSGTNTEWTGNFTRHRVADRGLQQKLEPRMGSEREYQRMNTTYAIPSNNLQDFAPLKFVE